MPEPTDQYRLPSHAELAGLVGHSVVADGSVLVELAGLTHAQRHGELESFSMEFSGSWLPQGMHTLNLPGYGPVEVFLVPVAPGRSEAAVTRTAR